MSLHELRAGIGLLLALALIIGWSLGIGLACLHLCGASRKLDQERQIETRHRRQWPANPLAA